MADSVLWGKADILASNGKKQPALWGRFGVMVFIAACFE